MGDRPIDWAGLRADDHVMQIYDADEQLVESLCSYASDGLRRGQSVVVIATEAHREALRSHLEGEGFLLDRLVREDRYIALPAADTLELFMRRGEPDEASFRAVIGDVIGRACAQGRTFRAFGEMVALLWAAGNRAGAVRLEQLWRDLVATEAFALFCAYPRPGFGREFSSAVHSVCASHTRVFGA
jgi:hypothetical protein